MSKILKDQLPADRPIPVDSDHWLARPTTIRLLWWAFSIVLLVTVLAQLVFKVKGYFGVDGWMGFGAIFGFLACLAMVLVAKALGWVLKRKQDYYRDNLSNADNGTGTGKEDKHV